MLYNAYLPNQIEPGLLKELVDLGTEIEKNFSTFRGTIDGEKVTDNEIKEILKDQTDSAKRKQAWLASKQVGSAVADDIIRLVKLRNQAAKKLGYANYWEMQIKLQEHDPDKVEAIFEVLGEELCLDSAGVAARETVNLPAHGVYFMGNVEDTSAAGALDERARQHVERPGQAFGFP